MVKHIVVYTLKEGFDKDEAVKLIASKLEPLVGQIPGLLKMEVRRCFAGMDYALYSEFEKPEDVKPIGPIPSIRRPSPISITCWIPVYPLIMRSKGDIP